MSSDLDVAGRDVKSALHAGVGIGLTTQTLGTPGMLCLAANCYRTAEEN